MILYPYNSPIIMTDAIYSVYGGHTGSSTIAQRQASFLLAEETVSDDIGTFLLPTNVTGSYVYNPTRELFLDHAYVNNLIQIWFVDGEGTTYYTDTAPSLNFVLVNSERGIVNINRAILESSVFCPHSSQYPAKILLAYNAGFPSGTSYHPNILLALTKYSEIILNEIIGFGNESSGDIGVKSFRNQRYSEDRVALLRTNFGTSAVGQFVHKLLSKFRKYRRVGL